MAQSERASKPLGEIVKHILFPCGLSGVLLGFFLLASPSVAAVSAPASTLPVAAGAANTRPTAGVIAKPACPGDPRPRLAGVVGGLIAAVKTPNPAAIIALIGDQGLTIGEDGAAITKAELKRDFDARTGRYCDFFVCGGKPGFLNRLIQGPGQASAPSLVRGRWFAVVTIAPGSGTAETELHFRWADSCRWELTAIGYL